MVSRLLLFLVVLGTAGCAATGATYTEDQAVRTAISPKNSRLTIFRGDHIQYSARSVRIGIDGTTVGSVDNKGFNVFDVSPGRHILAADMWDAPGKCEVALDLKPANAYYFEIMPRQGSLYSGLALGVLGMAAESAGKQCGGAFEIVPVPEDAAVRALQPLRLTK